jgi:hypothetical protein
LIIGVNLTIGGPSEHGDPIIGEDIPHVLTDTDVGDSIGDNIGDSIGENEGDISGILREGVFVIGIGLMAGK